MLDIRFEKLKNNDLPKLVELVGVYDRVFEMQDFRLPENGYLQGLLDNQQIIFYVATDRDNNVVGGLTAYILPSVYYPAAEVYIYDLAVEINWQRKGIGRRLIDTLNAYCKELGCKFVFVQADQVDQHAIDFYRATGGMQEDVVHFDYRL